MVGSEIILEKVFSPFVLVIIFLVIVGIATVVTFILFYHWKKYAFGDTRFKKVKSIFLLGMGGLLLINIMSFIFILGV